MFKSREEERGIDQKKKKNTQFKNPDISVKHLVYL